MQPFTFIIAALQLGAAVLASPLDFNATEVEERSLVKRGGFQASCNGISLLDSTFPSVLTAQCADYNGVYRRTDLSLNYCFENRGGDLVPAPFGKYKETCDVKAGEIRPYTTYCVPCKKWGGEWNKGCFRLNDVITNVNGQMECFGYRGL